jgi:hypothetical protein
MGKKRTFLHADKARADRKDGLRIDHLQIWIEVVVVIAVKVYREGLDHFIKRERPG